MHIAEKVLAISSAAFAVTGAVLAARSANWSCVMADIAVLLWIVNYWWAKSTRAKPFDGKLR